jgi:post-segregation antitoxin (ccd killing protein)
MAKHTEKSSSASRRMKNVTVTLDEETFAKARVRAAERNLSLSRLMSELLARELRHDDAYEAAYRGWRAARPFLLKGPPQRYPKREELYDRPVFRRR